MVIIVIILAVTTICFGAVVGYFYYKLLQEIQQVRQSFIDFTTSQEEILEGLAVRQREVIASIVENQSKINQNHKSHLERLGDAVQKQSSLFNFVSESAVAFESEITSEPTNPTE